MTPFASFVFGTTQQDLRIPPTGCSLSTAIVVFVPVLVGPNGRLQVTIDIPPGIVTDLTLQYLVATAAQDRRTSEALRVRLP